MKFMKKIIENYEMIITGVIFTIIIIAMCLGLSGCGETKTIVVNTNTESTTPESNTYLLGRDALIEIGNCLYYDSTTGIVYWWNGFLDRWNCDTIPSPYYSSNGLLCKYNPNTNTIEEVKAKGEN